MKQARVLILSLFLSGCGLLESEHAQAQEACAAYISEKLKAPSTFQMRKISHSIDLLSKEQYLAVSDEGTMGKLGTDVVNTYPQPGLHTVIIDYEAENSFGAPVRNLEMCRFLMEDAEQGKYARDDLRSEAESRATIEQLQATTAALTGEETKTGGCCLRRGADESAIRGLKNLKVKIEDLNA